MAHFAAFGLQIGRVMRIVDDPEGDARRDFNVMARERGHFLRIVGQEPDIGDAEVVQDFRRDFIFTLIRLKTETFIGCDGVVS